MWGCSGALGLAGGVQGEGGALGSAESLALHFGVLSKGNGRAEGGVRGGVVLMRLMLADCWGPHRRKVNTWRPWPDTVGHDVAMMAP
jgi:hypothetical protein